jgi:hypothetical protein
MKKTNPRKREGGQDRKVEGERMRERKRERKGERKNKVRKRTRKKEQKQSERKRERERRERRERHTETQRKREREIKTTKMHTDAHRCTHTHNTTQHKQHTAVANSQFSQAGEIGEGAAGDGRHLVAAKPPADNNFNQHHAPSYTSQRKHSTPTERFTKKMLQD